MEDLRDILRQLQLENAQLKHELKIAYQRFVQKVEEIEEVNNLKYDGQEDKTSFRP